MSSARKSDAKEDAKQLAQSVAVLKKQAEEEEANRKKIEAKRVVERKDAEAKHGISLPPLPDYKPYNPSIVHPGIAYGYDAKGSALKQWMEPIRNAIAGAITTLEQRKSEVEADRADKVNRRAAAIPEQQAAEQELQSANDASRLAENKAAGELDVYRRSKQRKGIKDDPEDPEIDPEDPEIAENKKAYEEAERVREAAAEKLARAITQKEEKDRNVPLAIDAEEKSRSNIKKAEDLQTSINRIKSFEQEIKDMQNGWLDGQPIELKAMQDKVADLKAEFEKPELKNAEESKKAVEECKRFDAVLKDEVARLKNRAGKQASTNITFEMQGQILERRVFSEKLEKAQAKKWKMPGEGTCLLVACENEQKLDDMVRTKLGVETPRVRAYVLVGDPNNRDSLELFYVNKRTGEREKVCEAKSQDMHALLRELDQGDSYYTFNYLLHRHLSGAVRRPEGAPGQGGEVLLDAQEERIRRIVHHAHLPEHVKKDERLADWKEPSAIDPTVGDWKEILPIAIRTASDASTALIEAAEERETRAREERDLDATTARNNALERLKQKQLEEGMCQYDSNGWRFTITSKKDEKDDGRLCFSVTMNSGFLGASKNVRQGMKSMIETCYLADPMRAVVLTAQAQRGDNSGVSDRIVKNLEYAIEEAEKLAKKGIYIGIKFDDNALAAIESQGERGNNKNLVLRAQELCDLWKKNVVDVQDKKKTAAMAGESDLGALLKTQQQRGIGMGDELTRAFTIKGNTPEDKKDRLEELKKEVQKMEGAFSQLTSQDSQIKRQLDEVDAEMKKPDVRRDPEKYAEFQEKKASLEAAQITVNQKLQKLAETKSGEIGNCLQWMDSAEMRDVLLGLDGRKISEIVDIRDGKSVNLPPLDSEAEVAFLDLRERVVAISEEARKMQAAVPLIVPPTMPTPPTPSPLPLSSSPAGPPPVAPPLVPATPAATAATAATTATTATATATAAASLVPDPLAHSPGFENELKSEGDSDSELDEEEEEKQEAAAAPTPAAGNGQGAGKEKIPEPGTEPEQEEQAEQAEQVQNDAANGPPRMGKG